MAKACTQRPQFASEIERFCDLMATAQSDYTWHRDQITQMDKLTQDYLHKLELENLDYGERAKIATKLTKVRQYRRENKDTAEVLEPLVQFLDSEKGRQMFNLLREVLGRTRKMEDRMESRIYIPRVLSEGPIK